MFFWNLKELKNALIRNELSEGKVFGYVLITVVMSALIMEISRYYSPGRVGVWDYVNSVFSIFIVFFGTFMAYRANGGSEGVNFAARYFSISIVVTIRYMFFLIPIGLAVLLAFFYSLSQGSSLDKAMMTDGVEVVLLTIWYILIYWAIARNIRDVAKA
ncbi:MAG: hypothetical protein ACN6PP_20905 [Delftia tsuruhatensis]|uniref:hypothetical protein n=1 Tax=Delftia lacustris TaxID=558537 RepID=UPI0035A74046